MRSKSTRFLMVGAILLAAGCGVAPSLKHTGSAAVPNDASNSKYALQETTVICPPCVKITGDFTVGATRQTDFQFEINTQALAGSGHVVIQPPNGNGTTQTLDPITSASLVIDDHGTTDPTDDTAVATITVDDLKFVINSVYQSDPNNGFHFQATDVTITSISDPTATSTTIGNITLPLGTVATNLEALNPGLQIFNVCD